MFHSIVVTSDFSEASRQSFPLAARLARELGASLVVAHIVRPAKEHVEKPVVMGWEPAGGAAAASELCRERLESRLLESIQATGEFDGLEVKPLILAAELEEAIEKLQECTHLDLLIVGSQRSVDSGRYFVDSFASDLLRHVPCSVLIERRDPSEPAVRSPDPAWRHILVPYNFSETSHRALDRACELARPLGARVRLLFVVDESTPPAGLSEDARRHLETHVEAVSSRARQQLRQTIEDGNYGPFLESHVARGRPEEEILREISTNRPDLVVIGSRGRQIGGHFLLGAVAERTLIGARCRVLVVRPGRYLAQRNVYQEQVIG